MKTVALAPGVIQVPTNRHADDHRRSPAKSACAERCRRQATRRRENNAHNCKNNNVHTVQYTYVRTPTTTITQAARQLHEYCAAARCAILPTAAQAAAAAAGSEDPGGDAELDMTARTACVYVSNLPEQAPVSLSLRSSEAVHCIWHFVTFIQRASSYVSSWTVESQGVQCAV